MIKIRNKCLMGGEWLNVSLHTIGYSTKWKRTEALCIKIDHLNHIEGKEQVIEHLKSDSNFLEHTTNKTK